MTPLERNDGYVFESSAAGEVKPVRRGLRYHRFGRNCASLPRPGMEWFVALRGWSEVNGKSRYGAPATLIIGN